MNEEINSIKYALIIIAEAIESGEWQGLENDVREVIGWERLKDNLKV